mmetsp:Transcript_2906/g.8505  ORF Transcript_2906/g.8505 Transcript_2906/m.8505 type:complete len:215 (-) Transcript_2906:151-795(-)
MLILELFSNVRRLNHQPFSKTSIYSAISLFAQAYTGTRQDKRGQTDLILAASLSMSGLSGTLEKVPLALRVIQLCMPNQSPSQDQHTYITCVGVTILLLEARANFFQPASDEHVWAVATVLTSVVASHVQKHSESNNTAPLWVSILRSFKRLIQTSNLWSLSQSALWREVFRLADSCALNVYVPVILNDWHQLKLPGAPDFPATLLEDFRWLRF